MNIVLGQDKNEKEDVIASSKAKFEWDSEFFRACGEFQKAPAL